MRKIATLILGVLGLFTSLKLSQIYFDANFATNYAGSFCSINSVVDCDGVARSGYSTFLGIPWSLYGIGFYLLVIGLAFFDDLKERFGFLKCFEEFEHPENYIYVMSIFSIFLSLYLAWVSTFQLHKICLLCYFMYGVNIALFLTYATKLSIRESVKVSIEDTKSFLKHAHNKKFFSVFFVFAFASVLLINQTQIFIPQNFTDLFSGNVLGNLESRAKIQVYTDYQCPYCAMMNNQLYKLAHRLGGIKVELIDFPLDSDCNPLVEDGKGHKGSCMAARYAMASKKQCKFLEYNSAIFKNNYNLTEDKLIKIADSVGLDTKKLQIDANSVIIKKQLEDKIKRALSKGITATPTTQVGMKIYNYFLPYDELYIIVSEYKEAFENK